MTRNELITELCKREGGKRQALDAGQCREVLAKLRAIIGEEIGIDLYEAIQGRCICIDAAGLTERKHDHYEAFPVYAWRNGKPVKK